MKNFFKRLLLFHPFAFLGPGLIATAAGNDAGGIATYAAAGALYGFKVLWIMIPLTFSFVLVQEMSARIGAATGKGFSDLVREHFDLRATVFMMVLLLLGNAGLVISEFAGIAAGLEMLGISKYISIPLSAGALWWLVVKGSYESIEKLFLAMSAVLISYCIAMFAAGPSWLEVGQGFVIPYFPLSDSSYSLFMVALIGTTIAPFMQIYAQSAVVEKGITMREFKKERLDTYTGTIFANIVAVAIIIATASTLHKAGIRVETAADAARALVPFAGQFAFFLFAIGLFGASMLAAGVVPITTSFALANAFGWESGVNRNFKEAPLFYAIFTALIVFGATVTLSPAVSLIKLLVGLQVINGILLPIQLLFMMRLANNPDLMGKHVNGRWFNIGMYATIGTVGTAVFLFFALSARDVIQNFLTFDTNIFSSIIKSIFSFV